MNASPNEKQLKIVLWYESLDQETQLAMFKDIRLYFARWRKHCKALDKDKERDYV